MSTLLSRLGVGLLALVSIGAISALVVPTDVQLPGTQPGEIVPLTNYNSCSSCHANYDPAAEPGHNWRGSMMAHAARDPLFWGAMAVAEQDFDGSGDFCLRCHTPNGWIGGRSVPTDGSALDPDLDADGVSCDTCHRITNPDTSEHFGTQNTPFESHDGGVAPEGWVGNGQYVLLASGNIKLGPYDDPDPLHGWAQSLYHRDPQLCGTCHDVSNPVTGDLAPNNGAQVPLAPGTFSDTLGAPVSQKAAFNNAPHAYGVVERTFSEHQSSAFAALPVSAYSTLPGELHQGALADAQAAAVAADPSGNYIDGAIRTFSCQTCHMKPVEGRGCVFPTIQIRPDLPSHDLTGGNYWVPDAIAYMDTAGTLPFGGGLDTAQLMALSDGADRARDTLELSAALDVSGATLRVVNLTGHKLISGYPEGRRMWLHVTWYDAGAAILREDGAYGSITADIDGSPTAVDSLLDPADPHLVEFMSHHGISQEWAAELLTLGLSSGLPLEYDRLTGAVTHTLGALAASAPGTAQESFHFVLNDTILSDTRIPPYQFSYDAARERNALPVPETLYGNPGPGGTYRHWAEVDLDPPVGAVTADIELLYQPTSWEYLQFLHLANDGSVTNLADVGDDLLDAWLATGMAAPHQVAATTWTAGASVSPFVDLGAALAGTNGLPSLTGSGPCLPGESIALALENARPSTAAYFVIGLSEVNAPFKGGTLVPSADAVVAGIPVGPTGSFHWLFTWPTSAISGLPLTMQYWIPDPAGVVGWAASNGLRATTP